MRLTMNDIASNDWTNARLNKHMIIVSSFWQIPKNSLIKHSARAISTAPKVLVAARHPSSNVKRGVLLVSRSFEEPLSPLPLLSLYCLPTQVPSKSQYIRRNYSSRY